MSLEHSLHIAPAQSVQPALITIEFTTSDQRRDESDLHHYLREALHVKSYYDLAESVDWVPEVCRVYVPAAAGYALGKLAEYSGKKLIDVLTIHLQKWFDKRSTVSEVTLYDADGRKIELRKK